MLRYTLKRLAVGILTLAALATITFFLMKIIPGSPFGGELAQLSPEVRGNALLPSTIWISPSRSSS